MRHLLSVMTAPRPPTAPDYLSNTLKTLEGDSAGEWRGERLIYSDGPFMRSRPAGWEIVERPKAGQLKAMWGAFELALERDVDLLTFLEDDILVCKNGLSFIQTVAVPDRLAFVSWYSYLRLPPDLNEIAITNPNGRYSFLGACGFTVPKRTLRVLVDGRSSVKWPWDRIGDGLMSHILKGQSFGVYVPNLVQHVGYVSSFGGNGLSRSRMSPTFDAAGPITS